MANTNTFRWSIRLTLVSAVAMAALVAFFYAADDKTETMRVVRALNPATATVLPRLTENIHPTRLIVRIYDFLVVLTMAVQGFVLGAIVDAVRYWRHRRRPER